MEPHRCRHAWTGALDRSPALSTLWAETGRLLHWHRSPCPPLSVRARCARERETALHLVRGLVVDAARLAQKQFDATDPDNRLVAEELERRWNQALQRVREIKGRIDHHVQGQRQVVIPTREDFEDLAADLEAVWNDPHADIRLKKRLVRTLIHEIVVDIDAAAGEILLVIHWKGGAHTELRLPRRRRGQNSAQTSKDVIEAVRRLARICPDDLLANVLNRNGLLTGRGNRWTENG
jgi:hypothetical protein